MADVSSHDSARNLFYFTLAENMVHSSKASPLSVQGLSAVEQAALMRFAT